MRTEMGTAASITSDTIRRAAPLAFAPALGACGTMTRMMGSSALAKSGDGFNDVWRLAKP
jgi:hypothetical protein